MLMPFFSLARRTAGIAAGLLRTLGHVVVGVARLAPHLAHLETAMIHGTPHVQWVTVELCEVATLFVKVAHVIQFPCDRRANQFQQR